MPRARKLLLRAKIEGRDLIHPGRFKNRREPASHDVGDPPTWMSKAEVGCWNQFMGEVPWLRRAHRPLLEIAVRVRAKLTSGEAVAITELQLLRQCLGQMGATPADATKVSEPEHVEPDEIELAYFS